MPSAFDASFWSQKLWGKKNRGNKQARQWSPRTSNAYRTRACKQKCDYSTRPINECRPLNVEAKKIEVRAGSFRRAAHIFQLFWPTRHSCEGFIWYIARRSRPVNLANGSLFEINTIYNISFNNGLRKKEIFVDAAGLHWVGARNGHSR